MKKLKCESYQNYLSQTMAAVNKRKHTRSAGARARRTAKNLSDTARAHIKKMKQEVCTQSMSTRYIVCADVRAEVEAQHPEWCPKQVQRHADERWQNCFALDLYDIEGEVKTKAEWFVEWLPHWSWNQCERHFQWCTQNAKPQGNKRTQTPLSPRYEAYTSHMACRF